jgi:arginine utilization regulatory protein
LFAQSIHYASRRRERPFLAQNCAALPESLLEGILFGTVKGSYTDAVERDGMFRLADGGTLFLDEVDTMPLDVQKKLLKAMEEGRVRPLGSSEEYFFDIRIIASCNSSLDSLIRSPRLRPDFYFRLAVLQFEMPPLRKRGRDVLLIADYYIREYNRSLRRNVQGFDRETEAFLLNYAWPGNVRELVNLVAGLFVSTSADLFTMEDVRKVADEPFSEARENGSEEDYRRFLAGGQTLPVFLRQAEEKEIRRALEECDGDLARCAEVLGLSLQTLRRKVKHYFDSKKP